LWSIPKGLPEKNEPFEDAAKRELYEETNLKLDDFNHSEFIKLPDSPYTKQRKTLISFLVFVNKDLSSFKFKCHSLVDGKFPEVDKFEWVDEQGLQRLHESQSRLIPGILQLVNHRNRNK
jgi:8-oxo-dGTP pyrophosphatase MutT (NUDIX family)